MKVKQAIASSPLWFLISAVGFAITIWFAMQGYEPLTFDPSLYEGTDQAFAATLATVEPDEAARQTETPANDVAVMEAPVIAGLEDGEYTGYAPCGVGNSDRWSPYYIAITIRVVDGKVVEITAAYATSQDDAGGVLSWDPGENASYLNKALYGNGSVQGVLYQLQANLPSQGAVPNIDTVSGATYSSIAIYNAYLDALRRASSSAGAASTPPAASVPEQKPASAPPQIEIDNGNVGALADGTWVAFDACGPDPLKEWSPYYVGVSIVVKDGKITSINKIYGSSQGEKGAKTLNWDAQENSEYLDGAAQGVKQQIEQALAAGKLPSRIDAVSGATYSSESILRAFYGAVQKSAAAGGASVTIPDDDQQDDTSNQNNQDNTDDPGTSKNDDDDDVYYYGFALCESVSASEWSSYYVVVKVSATDGSVADIIEVYGDAAGDIDEQVLYKASENASYLNWAIDGKFGGRGYRMKSVVSQIREKIEKGLEVMGIATVSGATRSSTAIIEAYKMAAENAAANRGTSLAEAVALTKAGDDTGDDNNTDGGATSGDGGSTGTDTPTGGTTGGSTDTPSSPNMGGESGDASADKGDAQDKGTSNDGPTTGNVPSEDNEDEDILDPELGNQDTEEEDEQ